MNGVITLLLNNPKVEKEWDDGKLFISYGNYMVELTMYENETDGYIYQKNVNGEFVRCCEDVCDVGNLLDERIAYWEDGVEKIYELSK